MITKTTNHRRLACMTISSGINGYEQNVPDRRNPSPTASKLPPILTAFGVEKAAMEQQTRKRNQPVAIIATDASSLSP